MESRRFTRFLSNPALSLCPAQRLDVSVSQLPIDPSSTGGEWAGLRCIGVSLRWDGGSKGYAFSTFTPDRLLDCALHTMTRLYDSRHFILELPVVGRSAPALWELFQAPVLLLTLRYECAFALVGPCGVGG